MSYENPINIIVNNICSDIQKKEDEYFMECVHNVGVDVNKEELIRALQYDRQQYEKGYKDGFDKALKWIPVSERLPKAGEHIGIVEKYYLVQNEYGDMLVARYTHSEYWEQIYQLQPISDKIVAWMPLPEPYMKRR